MEKYVCQMRDEKKINSPSNKETKWLWNESSKMLNDTHVFNNSITAANFNAHRDLPTDISASSTIIYPLYSFSYTGYGPKSRYVTCSTTTRIYIFFVLQDLFRSEYLTDDITFTFFSLRHFSVSLRFGMA